MISTTETRCPEPLPPAAEGSNDGASAAWDGVLFDKFVRFRPLLTLGLGCHGTRAIQRHCRSPGQRVLDLGCGFGDSALDLATTAAQVVGIDVAPRFVRAAQAAARSAGVRNVQYVVGDVQSAALGGPYDLAFSRFGMMFFSRPVAALRNVWRSLRSEGTLCLVVWRKREDNPVVHRAEHIARRIVPEVTHSGEPTCGPGPFSMASADVTSDLLHAAGFHDVTFERQDAPICIGRDVEEAVEFALELGPAGELIRLAREEGQRLRPVVASALREEFSRLQSDSGVFLPASTWIVTARKRSNSAD